MLCWCDLVDKSFGRCVTAKHVFFDFRDPGPENLIGTGVFKGDIPNSTFNFRNELGMSHLQGMTIHFCIHHIRP